MPTRPLSEQHVGAVPFEYSGKWIAWNADHTQIVAHSDNFPELWKIVREMQIDDPIFQKVPRADVRFIGGPRTTSRQRNLPSA